MKKMLSTLLVILNIWSLSSGFQNMFKSIKQQTIKYSHNSCAPLPHIGLIKNGMKNTLINSAALVLGGRAIKSMAEEGIPIIPTPITRADVGFINLNETMPPITSVCWFDIQVGDSSPQRIEISLFGNTAPKTVENFVALCKGDPGYGYKGSDIFRIISRFSVQGGNIGSAPDSLLSRLSRDGKSASGIPFPAENYRILHSYKDAGVVSMMKDVTNKGSLDSRFFITLEPYASWADEKYSAFGLVTKGMNLITGLTIIPVQPPSNYPLTRVRIVDSNVY